MSKRKKLREQEKEKELLEIKLKQENDLQNQSSDQEQDSESEDEQPVSRNKFAFADLEEDEDEEEEEEEEEEHLIKTDTKIEELQNQEEKNIQNDEFLVKVEEEKGKQKKKKKNKRKKKKKEENKEIQPTNTPQQVEDELDLIFKEMNIKPEEESKYPGEYGPNSILKLELNRLNSEKEFNKLFKQSGFEADMKREREETSNLSKKARKKLDRFMKLQNKAKSKIKNRRVIMQNETYKAMKQSPLFKMDIVDLQDGNQIFSFQPTAEYTTVHNVFEQIQRSADIHQMIEFSQKNFFHPESQLVISEYLILKSEFSNATQFIERCLAIFENGFHFKFNPLKDPPNTRLSLKSHKLDLIFYTAIFKYIDILGRKGCNKTALEFTKFLLSLDPLIDPFGGLMILDYYAIRSKEEEYLIRFTKEFLKELYTSNPSKSMSLLLFPNYAFSCALAKKSIEGEENEEEDLMTEIAKIFSIVDLNSLLELSSSSLLICAIILFPSFFKVILQKSGAEKNSSFKHILGSAMLNSADNYYKNYKWILPNGENSFERKKRIMMKILDIFSEKIANCFGGKLIQEWMLKVGTFIISSYANGNIDLESLRTHLSNLATLPFDLEKYENLRVVDFKEDMTSIAAEELHPLIESRVFNAQPRQQNTGNLDASMNPLYLFLASLLPWNNFNPNNSNNQT